MSPELRSRASQPLGSTATHYYPLTASLPISQKLGVMAHTWNPQSLKRVDLLSSGEGEIRRRSPQRLPPSQRVRKPAPSPREIHLLSYRFYSLSCPHEDTHGQRNSQGLPYRKLFILPNGFCDVVIYCSYPRSSEYMSSSLGAQKVIFCFGQCNHFKKKVGYNRISSWVGSLAVYY